MNKKQKIAFLTALIIAVVYFIISAKKVASDGVQQATELINIRVIHGFDAKTYAKEKTGEEWLAFDYIIRHESNWCHTKWNGQNYCPDTPRATKLKGHSGAYGLCQTMIKSHDVYNKEFMNSEKMQIDWCIDYARKRYGSITKAKKFWEQNHWW